ncbi:rho GTPase-activating protein SYDE2-like [Carcharodon carcharias]|uniref:rho GTPase-activating protein SYDE2-like n=1 Tax=Carcharodon carcharias TaxID=13397 RepID=UPI001B7DD6F4|nr:rho GTPase-activating protein SYDE2-like [Carcharodon carcharias]
MDGTKSDVSERPPIAAHPETAPVPKCESGELRAERTDLACASKSPSDRLLPPSAPESLGCGGASYPGPSVCPLGPAKRPSRELGVGAAGQVPGGGGQAKGTAEEGEIWYNPIPEDLDLVRVPRRPEPSRAQWYVEVPGPADGPRKPGCVVTVPGGNEATALEQPAARHASKPSPPNAHRTSTSTPAAGVSWSGYQAGAAAQKAEPSEGAADPRTESGRTPPASPRPSKKSAAAHRSLSDRVKSPGTVRRLSMKMKKLPELRRKLSLRGTSRSSRHDKEGGGGALESTRPGPSGRASPPPPLSPSPSSPSMPLPVSNVICRYHLDSSVLSRGSSCQRKKQRSSRALGKGGYLSDGDSPELVAKAGKPDGGPWCREKEGAGGGCQLPAGAKLDTGAFRPYGGREQPRCLQYLSGLINVRLYGIEGVKLPRAGLRDIFCAIQVDSVSKARTAMLTCQDPFLSLDHTFNIELEHSQQLKLLVFSWDPGSSRNRVCCHGTAVLPPLFKGARTHQLAMKLEPRGVLYLKVSLVELWEVPLCCAEDQQEPRVFRMELDELVERENSGAPVPLLIQKCVSEIENRGLKAVGLYRLCGSAAVKKELRDSFERDSASVNLSEEIYPDINVITGILKDYLRELPSPLITKMLYEVVLEAMAKWPLKMTMGVPDASQSPANTVALLDCLPEAEKATLTLLLDHLSLVASLQESNKMTCQNLAVCFGPVLLSQKQETSQPGARTFPHSRDFASALDFKRHIEVLHYLLQLWPSDRIQAKRDRSLEQPRPAGCLRSRHQPLSLPPPTAAAEEVVCRTRVGRAPSCSRNRHAGDWSSCGRSYLGPGRELEPADRGQVPALGLGLLDAREPGDRQDGGSYPDRGQDGGAGELDFESALAGRAKDFDSLIADIERELAKKIIFL